MPLSSRSRLREFQALISECTVASSNTKGGGHLQFDGGDCSVKTDEFRGVGG